VVGHSLGGAVTVALSEQSPELVKRAVIVDMPPDDSYGDLGFIASLAFQPVLGQALWEIKPDFSVRDGLEVAFAPGYDVPDAFVEDVKRLTYTAYDDSPGGNDDYLAEAPLDQRMKATGKPLMVLMGAEEQIVDDPQRALDQYKAAVPEAETHLVPGAGHSPNVERPALTAKLVLRFAHEGQMRIPSPQHRASGVRGPAGNR
jgi:pimeloyl-ACP methyl ester carboxylesterase